MATPRPPELGQRRACRRRAASVLGRPAAPLNPAVIGEPRERRVRGPSITPPPTTGTPPPSEQLQVAPSPAFARSRSRRTRVGSRRRRHVLHCSYLASAASPQSQSAATNASGSRSGPRPPDPTAEAPDPATPAPALPQPARQQAAPSPAETYRASPPSSLQPGGLPLACSGGSARDSWSARVAPRTSDAGVGRMQFSPLSIITLLSVPVTSLHFVVSVGRSNPMHA